MSVSFSTIRPGVRLADQVASTLEAEIRHGRLEAGHKLPTEQQLSQQFGVSRTVVREAVSQLKSMGLIASRQGSGMYVQAAGCEPLAFDPAVAASREAVLQILEVRRALESEVAELAAQRRTEAHLQAIHGAMAAIAAAVERGGDGVEEDVQFHRAIAQAAGNPYLISTLDYLSQFLRGATRVTRANEARRLDFRQDVTREHEAVVAAIERRDPAQARAAAARHMHNAVERIALAGPEFWIHDGGRLAQALMPGAPD